MSDCSCVLPQDVLPSDLLVESGVQLGVCEKGSVESLQMASDYLSAVQAMKHEELRGTGWSWAEVGFLHSSQLVVLFTLQTLTWR